MNKKVLDDVALAERLKALRKSYNLSAKELAETMNRSPYGTSKITPSAIYAYENLQNQTPVRVLDLYAQFFDVSLDFLFYGKNE